MSAIAQALDSFRKGELSREELLLEVDRQLTSGEHSAAALLAALNDAHLKEALPQQLHTEIARKLLYWRERVELERPRRPRPSGASFDLDPLAGPVSPTFEPSAGAHADDPQDSQSAQLDPAVAALENEPPVVVPFEGEPIIADEAVDVLEALRNRPVAVGSVLQGRFRLIKRLNDERSSSSPLYQAVDLQLVRARARDPYVAVRVVPLPADGFNESLALLRAEVKTLQGLSHPNLVRVMDCDCDGETAFVTTEFVVGESLAERFAAPGFTGLPARVALPLIRAIADGLSYAQRHVVARGPLESRGVMLTGDGAKLVDLVFAAPDRTGKATPLAELGPDQRDEVFRLAGLAFTLLTGQLAFDGASSNEISVTGARLPPHRQLSRAQHRAIAHAMEPDAARRTATADQFLSELESPSGARRGDVVTAVIGGVLIAGLIAGYLIDHGRIARWIVAQRGTAVLAPATGQLFRDCPTCPLMKALPAGRFDQGAAREDDGATLEQPRHAVEIAYPFAMGVYEVTVGEFKEFVDATGHQSAGCQAYDGTWQANSALNWNNVGFPQTPTHPVVCVSWRDAQAYAGWLSHKTGQHYRMPSESEWEYAARAGSQASRPWGDNLAGACADANIADETAARRYSGWTVVPCSDGNVYSAPVGSYQPNAFGLYDTLGNAFEWVQDCWHDSYQGAPTNGAAWTGGNCTQRAMRGGSWFTVPSRVSVAARNHFEDTYRSITVGFRLVREVQP